MNELPRPPAKKSKIWKNAWTSYGSILADERRLSSAAILQLHFLCDLITQMEQFDAAIDGNLTHTNSQGVVAHPLLQHRARCQSQVLQQIRAMHLEVAKPKSRNIASMIPSRPKDLNSLRPSSPPTRKN